MSLIQRLIPIKEVGNTLVFSILVVKLEKIKNDSEDYVNQVIEAVGNFVSYISWGIRNLNQINMFLSNFLVGHCLCVHNCFMSQ